MSNLLPSSIPADGRILVRGVNWLGDAVMTTPALQRLRERFPRAHIALLTNEKLADVWLRHPSLDALITFTAKEGPWSVGRRLRTEAFATELTSFGAGSVVGRGSATNRLRRPLAKMVSYLRRAESPGSCANAQTLSQGD